MIAETNLLNLRSKASEILQRIEDQTADSIAGALNDVVARIAGWIEANPNATVPELYETLSILINEGAGIAADLMAVMGDAVVDVSLGVQARAIKALGITTANEIEAAASVWNDQFKLDLLREGHQEWYGMLKNKALHPGGSLRTTLEAANVWGEDLNSAVDLLIANDPDFSDFPPLEMDPIVRARMIVRTESTRFDNAVSVSLSEAVGIDHFINIGVGDDRQSDICQEATEQDPMTLDEWKASEWGVAPRHPNCRCALVGVGEEFAPSNATKERAGVLS